MKKFIITTFLLFSVFQVKAVDTENNNPSSKTSSTSGGPVVTVGGDINCDFYNIYEAIDSGSAEIRATYITFDENLDISNRNITIIGGYASCNDANSDIRTNIFTNVSGINLTPVITINNDSNSYSVTLENLELTYGSENLPQPGAGVSIKGSHTNVTIKNMRVHSNLGSGIGVTDNRSGQVIIQDLRAQGNKAYDGGGIYCSDSFMVVYGASTIYDNHAIGSGNNAINEGRGGGVFATSDCTFNYFTGANVSELEINGIINNKANYHGGGIYVEDNADIYLYGQPKYFNEGLYDSDGTIPVNIIGNVADYDQNNPNSHGGGIYATGTNSTVEINGAIIQQNNAPGSGGGVALYDNANLSMYRDPAEPCWDDAKCNYFYYNKAFLGGAISAETGATFILKGGWFERNASEFGSALSLFGVDTVGFVDGVLFHDNDTAAGFTVSSVFSVVNGSKLLMLFSTVVDNYAQSSVFSISSATLEMYGSLIFQNVSTPITTSVNSTISAECMYIYDNTGISGNGIYTTGTDPFIDRATKDFHLASFSEALDACAAHNLSYSYDMDNEPRGWDDPISNLSGSYDIGADESYASDVIFKNTFE